MGSTPKMHREVDSMAYERAKVNASEVLIKSMNQRGVNVKQLSKASRIKKRTIKKFLAGETDIRVGTLAILFDALDNELVVLSYRREIKDG